MYMVELYTCCVCLFYIHIAYIVKEVASLRGVVPLMGWHVNERMCRLQYRAVGRYHHVEL